jgi:hypothetical protein
MKLVKYGVAGVILFLVITIGSIFTTTSSQYIVTKIVEKYIKLDVIVHKPDITRSDYCYRFSFDKNSTATLLLNYSNPLRYFVELSFKGDISIFSEDVNITIAPLLIDSKAKFLSNHYLYLDSKILGSESNITLNIDTLKYNLDAKVVHKLLPETLIINSQGDLSQSIIKLRARLAFKNEALILDNLEFNRMTNHVTAQYQIALQKNKKEALYFHPKVDIFGRFDVKEIATTPEIFLELNSTSFSKKIDLIATNKKVKLNVNLLNINALLEAFDSNSSLKNGYVTTKITAYHDNFLEFNLSQLEVDISSDISGIIIEGIDLDSELDKFKNYQNISLFEGNFPGKSIGSALLTSPISLLSSKKVKQTEIDIVHIDAVITKSLFHCQDCALRSNNNLIAVDGAINIVSHNFKNFEIALLNKERCAYFIQEVYGDITSPKVKLTQSSLNLVTGMVESVGNAFKESVTTVTFTDKYLKCTPYYNGVLSYPLSSSPLIH